MKRSSPLASIVAATVFLAAAPVCSQPVDPERPFRGLFGGVNAPDPRAHQTLTFNLSLAEAYDDNIFLDFRPGNPLLAPPTSGYFTTLVTTADYAKRGRRSRVAASATSALRYYNELRQVKSLSHSAALGFSASVGRQTTLTINQAAVYSPSYLYNLFPDVAPPALGETSAPPPDYAAADLESYSYTTTARLTHGLSLRNSLSATADFRYLDYVHYDERRRDARTIGVAGEFARNVSRSSAFTARYHYRAGDLSYEPSAPMTREHGVDVGVNYRPTFSPTRSAELSMRLGSALIDVPELAGDPEMAGRHLTLTGELGLGYWFGRTWSARATYRRGVEYRAELAKPVFMQGASADVDGLLTRRLDLLVSGRYATGESALTRNGLFFDTYTGDARLRYALTRTLAAYAEYLYYFYDFHRSVQLPRDIPDVLERNAVRVGVALWLPALQR